MTLESSWFNYQSSKDTKSSTLANKLLKILYQTLSNHLKSLNQLRTHLLKSTAFCQPNNQHTLYNNHLQTKLATLYPKVLIQIQTPPCSHSSTTTTHCHPLYMWHTLSPEVEGTTTADRGTTLTIQQTTNSTILH